MRPINPNTRQPGPARRPALRMLFFAFGRTALLVAGLLCGLAASGQSINRPRVNSLLAELPKSRPDDHRIAILLELGRFHLYKPGESKADLDSSRTYFRRARQLSDSLGLRTRRHETESLLIAADLEGGQRASGRARFADLIRRCQRSGDREGEAIARVRFAVWLRNYAPDSAQVIGHFRRAAALYQSLHKPADEIHALKDIAVTHFYEGKLALAETELLAVLKRYKAIGYPNVHYTYNLLSSICRVKGDLNGGLKYALLCIDSMHKTADTASAAAFYGDLAQVYEAAGNHPQRMEWVRKSYAAWHRERLPNFALYHAAGIIAKDLIARRRPTEALRFIQQLIQDIPTNTIIQKGCVAQNLAYCYEALKNDRLAERSYLEALYWYEKNRLDFEGSLRVRQELGAFYLRQQRYKEAGDYLTKALTTLPQKEPLSALRDIHRMLFRVDSARGSYLSAIRHFQLYKALNDSLFNEAKSKQLAQLQIQYDTRTKEQNIALLTKQSELQQSALKRARTTQTAMMFGAVLLAGLLGVSYNRYRLKQRSNRLLEAKQREIDQKNQSLEQIVAEKEGLLVEKEWMLKEIHHRVKNNLQVITSLLNSQSDYLDDPVALAAIRESQSRVQTMALIHQRLYESDQLSKVDMAGYIGEVVDYLLETFSVQPAVRAEVDVAPVRLDVNLATPLGLIINETVTNSLKYAFPVCANGTRRPGVIRVTLLPLTGQTYRLVIRDDGVGLPEGFDPARSRTLGLTMIQGLSRQIGGQLRIFQESGVGIQLDFNPAKK
ncbi:histidine kinase dimerization/phosphoacceptor domain -containing protein [Tellurirhabdus rosea]|uniref:histidine kinase dimerization/phosphoacceptor domain -containing protein n=1 Tax=Tellurirhabdus rosea TaxID=2674997 RepID=UPI0022542F9D|nr:histidine kinase dimerization/phosphoacceptor domain -containing protein [Tellurirhabdus rosea]